MAAPRLSLGIPWAGAVPAAELGSSSTGSRGNEERSGTYTYLLARRKVALHRLAIKAWRHATAGRCANGPPPEAPAQSSLANVLPMGAGFYMGSVSHTDFGINTAFRHPGDAGISMSVPVSLRIYEERLEETKTGSSTRVFAGAWEARGMREKVLVTVSPEPLRRGQPGSGRLRFEARSMFQLAPALDLQKGTKMLLHASVDPRDKTGTLRGLCSHHGEFLKGGDDEEEEQEEIASEDADRGHHGPGQQEGQGLVVAKTRSVQEEKLDEWRRQQVTAVETAMEEAFAAEAERKKECGLPGVALEGFVAEVEQSGKLALDKQARNRKAWEGGGKAEFELFPVSTPHRVEITGKTVARSNDGGVELTTVANGDRVEFFRWGPKGERVAEYVNGRLQHADLRRLHLFPDTQSMVVDPQSGITFTVEDPSEWAAFVKSVAELFAAAKARGRVPPPTPGGGLFRSDRGSLFRDTSGGKGPDVFEGSEVASIPKVLAIDLGQPIRYSTKGEVVLRC